MLKIKLIYLILLLNVNLIWAESHRPQDFLRKIAGSKDEGVQIVQHYCAACHANPPLIELGAPKIGKDLDWKVRMQHGVGEMFRHCDEGINAMPARGGCFECSDKQLMLAILAMLPVKYQKSAKKSP